MEPPLRVKKMSLGLLFFLIGVSVPFDMLGAIPFVSILVTLLFLLMVKMQLMLHGYHAGVARMVFVFVGFLFIEVFFSLWPSALLYVITYYLFNNYAYGREKKRIEAHTA